MGTDGVRRGGPVLRRATAEMAADLAAVHVRSWQAAYRGVVPDGYLDGLDPDRRAVKLRASIEDRPEEFYAICDSARTVGILILGALCDGDTEGEGEVCALYLLPEYWGRGFGRAAMDFALSRLRALGYSAVRLWVFEQNARARRFYEACGFRPDGTRRDMTVGEPVPALRYVRAI